MRRRSRRFTEITRLYLVARCVYIYFYFYFTGGLGNSRTGSEGYGKRLGIEGIACFHNEALGIKAFDANPAEASY